MRKVLHSELAEVLLRCRPVNPEPIKRRREHEQISVAAFACTFLFCLPPPVNGGNDNRVGLDRYHCIVDPDVVQFLRGLFVPDVSVLVDVDVRVVTLIADP